MKTVTVNTILSELGLLAIRQVSLALPKGTAFEIKETSTNTTWTTHAASDLWMTKKGTLGSTQKTRKRFSIGTLGDIANELTWKKIELSKDFAWFVSKESAERKAQYAQTQAIIDSFNDTQVAAIWKEKLAEKNSQGRRGFAMQRLFKMGCTLVSTGQAREFQLKIQSM